MSSLSRLALLGISLLLSSPALAAPATNAEREALRTSQLAGEQFRQGHFQEAARLFRLAYETYPEPVLLHNLGRALDSDGALAEAIDAYRRYLDPEKAAVDRGAIERRIETLSGQLRERNEVLRRREQERLLLERARLAQPDAAVQVNATTPPAQRPSRARRAAPWIVFGAGAATLVAGATLGGLALREQNEARRSDVAALTAQEHLDTARSRALGANISYGIGATIAVAGLAWGIVEAVRARRAR